MKKILSVALAGSMLVGTVGAMTACAPNIISGTTGGYEVNLNVDRNTETTLRTPGYGGGSWFKRR